jgi:hypothetical protein
MLLPFGLNFSTLQTNLSFLLFFLPLTGSFKTTNEVLKHLSQPIPQQA